MLLLDLPAAVAICLGVAMTPAKTQKCENWAHQCMITQTILREGDKDAAFEWCSENIPERYFEEESDYYDERKVCHGRGDSALCRVR